MPPQPPAAANGKRRATRCLAIGARLSTKRRPGLQGEGAQGDLQRSIHSSTLEEIKRRGQDQDLLLLGGESPTCKRQARWQGLGAHSYGLSCWTVETTSARHRHQLQRGGCQYTRATGDRRKTAMASRTPRPARFRRCVQHHPPCQPDEANNSKERPYKRPSSRRRRCPVVLVFPISSRRSTSIYATVHTRPEYI